MTFRTVIASYADRRAICYAYSLFSDNGKFMCGAHGFVTRESAQEAAAIALRVAEGKPPLPSRRNRPQHGNVGNSRNHCNPQRSAP